MDIEKLKDRLLEWDGVDAVDNGEFTEVNYHGVFDLLREAADALEQLQAENDRLKRERDAAVKDYRVLPENCVCITTCGGKKVTIVLDVEAVKEAAHD